MRPRNAHLVLFLILSLVSLELISAVALLVLDQKFGTKFQPVNSLSSELAERILSSVDPNSFPTIYLWLMMRNMPIHPVKF